MQPGAAIGIPYGLWIEMSVMVDKAGRDDAPLGIDRALRGGATVFADPDDPAVLDRDIGLKRRLARTVDHAPVRNEQIECHRISSRWSARQTTALNGWPSTASPRPVPTSAPLIKTRASTLPSSGSASGPTGGPSTNAFCCALSASAKASWRVRSPRVSIISKAG